MSLINFMLSQVEHKFYNLRPGPLFESQLHYFQFLILELAILTPCIPMDFLIPINKISMRLPIVYLKGSQVEFSKV